MQETQSTVQTLESTIQNLIDKLDDLENRSRRKKLRIIGLSGQYKPGELLEICAEVIPRALGIQTCTVERAHTLGALHLDRKTPR